MLEHGQYILGPEVREMEEKLAAFIATAAYRMGFIDARQLESLAGKRPRPIGVWRPGPLIRYRSIVHGHLSEISRHRRLSVEERLALVEELWDSIAEDSAALPLTEAQRVELERRLADHEAHPEDVVSWDEVKASIAERLKR